MNCLSIINEDVSWRMSELASLRSIPLRYNLLEHHREMILKYTVPSIYSLWEGFVKSSFESYVCDINSLRLNVSEVNINLLVHGLTSNEKLKLERTRTSFKSKKEFIEHYRIAISKPFEITEVVPTNSNVTFDVINEILHLFNLDLLPDEFKKPLHRLVHFRNSIAHGEIKIPVKIEDIEKFANLLNALMVEITVRIDAGWTSRRYER